jgi:hypothetical protein
MTSLTLNPIADTDLLFADRVQYGALRRERRKRMILINVGA